MVFRIFKWILSITGVVTVVALIVIYNQQITDFSDSWQVSKEGEKAKSSQSWHHAIEIYEKGHKEHPDNTELSLALAKLYQYHGGEEAFPKAENLYRKLLELQPSNLEARLGLISLLMTRPDLVNQAVAQGRDALKLFQGDPKLLNMLGNIYKESAEAPCEKRPKVKQWLYEWAAYYYRWAIDKDPKMYESHFNLGVAHHQTQKLEKAAMSYCNALMLSPQRYEVHYNLGLVLVELNRVDEGYRHLAKSLHILREEGKDVEAMQLAEQIQAFKNTVYQESKYSGLTPHPPHTKEFLNPECLTVEPDTETKK